MLGGVLLAALPFSCARFGQITPFSSSCTAAVYFSNMASLSSHVFPSEPTSVSAPAGGKLGTPSSLCSADGQTTLPLQSSSVAVDVRDFLAEVIVQQEYVNNSSSSISAVYSFPMDSKGKQREVSNARNRE